MENKTLRLNDICKEYKLSRTSLWQIRQDDRFPKPVNLPYGGKIYFKEEIDNYFKSLQY